MHLPEPLRQQDFDGLAQQFSSTVSKNAFNLCICAGDAALRIRHHDRVRRQFEEFLKKLLGAV